MILTQVSADDAMAAANNAMFTVNNLWILISAVLVFIMHLGFSALEAGFVRKKNVVNILFKNAMIICIGILTYALCGFNLMYPGEFNGWLGFAGAGLPLPEGAGGLIDYADGAYSYYADFIFQAMFAATGATIVSGAVAERIKLGSFLIFATIFVAISYPITGSWKWGGGWLDTAGFYDFAGSTIVHSVGGWAALAGIILLGPRKGKYTAKGIRPITGHSMPLASIGKTQDLSMVLNGILGGLVGITAGADVIPPMSAVIVGFIAGIIIPIAVTAFDKAKLDDPVGATSVHLVCGIWGTLAV